MSSFYTANDIVTPSKFFALPKELFTERFANVSLDAKLVFAVLLDRVSLSIKNDHVDTDGNVYIVFRQESITELLGFCKRKVVSLFKELEAANMIERRKRGNNLPDLIYVFKLFTETVENSVDNCTSIEPTCKKVTQRDAKNAHQGDAKFAPVNNTNINNTKLSDTVSIYHDELHMDNESAQDNGPAMDRLSAEQFVKTNLDMDSVMSNLHDDDSRFVCSTILTTLTEIYSQKHGQLKINGYMVSYSSLRDKFMDLTSQHIEYVLDCVSKRDPATEPIRNWKAYLATALYNADGTMQMYYSNLVKFDKYKNRNTNKTVAQKFKPEGRDLDFLVV